MVHSIDLKYLSQITFNNPVLIKEMLQEWITDTETRIQEFEYSYQSSDPKKRFKMIHTLKTNYFMIGCVSMIKACENYLHSEYSDYDSKLILGYMNNSTLQIKNSIHSYIT